MFAHYKIFSKNSSEKMTTFGRVWHWNCIIKVEGEKNSPTD
ncbi:MAG: hypothetical protein ACJATF_004184 [Flavobacteriales bacterium]|jgi:hypothetical protein